MKEKEQNNTKISIIRVSPGAVGFLMKNKTKGIFYYKDKDGYCLINNLKGKMKTIHFTSLEELIANFS